MVFEIFQFSGKWENVPQDLVIQLTIDIIACATIFREILALRGSALWSLFSRYVAQLHVFNWSQNPRTDSRHGNPIPTRGFSKEVTGTDSEVTR
jgi:hypothetical protein